MLIEVISLELLHERSVFPDNALWPQRRLLQSRHYSAGEWAEVSTPFKTLRFKAAGLYVTVIECKSLGENLACKPFALLGPRQKGI